MTVPLLNGSSNEMTWSSFKFHLFVYIGEKEVEDKDLNSETPSLSEATSEKEANSVSQSNTVSMSKEEERSNSIKKVSWHRN